MPVNSTPPSRCAKKCVTRGRLCRVVDFLMVLLQGLAHEGGGVGSGGQDQLHDHSQRAVSPFPPVLSPRASQSAFHRQPRTKFMHDLIFSSLRPSLAHPLSKPFAYPLWPFAGTIASSHPCSFTWGSFTSSSTPCRSTLLDLRYVPDHFLPHARVHVTSRIAIGHVTLGAWCCASFEREGTRREGAMRRGVV